MSVEFTRFVGTLPEVDGPEVVNIYLAETPVQRSVS